MSWTTYANPNFQARRKKQRINLRSLSGTPFGGVDNINMLNSLYKGRQDRIERYRIYDWMDQDSDISRALDIMATHCTSDDENTGFPFEFDWSTEEPTREESVLLEENMKQWLKINKFKKRIKRNVRSVLKYGDWFYYRNQQTFELYNLHPKLVLGALVDNEKMEVLGWIVRDFKFNVEDMEVSQQNHALQDHLRTLTQGSGFQNAKIIPAIHIIHLTLNEGKFSGAASDDDPTDIYSSRWPFGESVLEQVYKTFKQRELLEDAAVIHRVQRAPTRRVWYIDVGKMRPDRAIWTINNFKNELNQKRIPQFIGDQGKTVDSVYNPQSQLEDYYIPVTADSRGSKVENLEGAPWSDLPDLKYFTMKMLRALRVPYSFMVGPEEGGSVFNDGKVGTAYMQEKEFSDFCRSIQIDLEDEYDFEFKLYLKIRDVNVNSADFTLKFNPPDNYEQDRQRMRDQENINVWMQVMQLPWISQRMAARKYGGWTEDELNENMQLKLEEDSQTGDQGGGGPGMGGMGGMGGGLGMGGMGGMGALPPPGMQGDMGGMGGEQNGLGMGGGGMTPAVGGGFGGGGMGRGGGGFGEAQEVQAKQNLLEEETEIGMSDIEPVEHKLKDMGTYKARTRKDQLFGAKDPIKDSPKVTLKMLRDIRIAHLDRRIENQKKLKIVAKVYQKPIGDTTGLGM